MCEAAVMNKGQCAVNFQYILDKIRSASISHEPYPHLYIDNLFSEADFQAITSSQDIKVAPASDDS